MDASYPSIRVQLPGLYDPSFAIPKDRIAIDPVASGNGAIEAPPTRSVSMGDARALQGDSDPAEFFDQYGFVLLEHQTQVKHWNTDGTNANAGNEITKIYAPEVEKLIRDLVLPDSGITYIFQSPAVITRGDTPDTDPYAMGVHQDYGISADEYQENLAAFTDEEVAANWRRAFEHSAGARFVALSLWRPIHMTEPVRHMPLAVCDPRSVRLEDLVPTSLVNFTPTGKPSVQMGLRYHPDQRWYYYSNMTTQEVLVINQFDLRRGESPSLRSCFHTAFELPDTPAGVQSRRSCEHRPQVFF